MTTQKDKLRFLGNGVWVKDDFSIINADGKYTVYKWHKDAQWMMQQYDSFYDASEFLVVCGVL